MEPNLDPWKSKAVAGRDEQFVRGLSHWENGEVDRALYYFRMADLASTRGDRFRDLYTSYHGLALVYSGDRSGLNFCRQVVDCGCRHAEVFCNLALAELRLNHRGRAYTTICAGLKINEQHPFLNSLRMQMGVRKSPILGFLSRDNVLNKFLGRLVYTDRRSKRA